MEGYNLWQMLVIGANIHCNYFDDPSPWVQPVESARERQCWAPFLRPTRHCRANSRWLSKTLLFAAADKALHSTAQSTAVQYSVVLTLNASAFFFIGFCRYFLARYVLVSKQLTGDLHCIRTWQEHSKVVLHILRKGAVTHIYKTLKMHL